MLKEFRTWHNHRRMKRWIIIIKLLLFSDYIMGAVRKWYGHTLLFFKSLASEGKSMLWMGPVAEIKKISKNTWSSLINIVWLIKILVSFELCSQLTTNYYFLFNQFVDLLWMWFCLVSLSLSPRIKITNVTSNSNEFFKT